MTLSVDVFVTGADGRTEVLDVPEGVSDLAGFESWRTTVWGSEAVRSLGTEFFPVLATGDLRVAAEQVPDFRRECAALRADLERVARGADSAKAPEEHVRQISARLRNIEDACDRARAVGGGVLVW
ncbi:hypothetical protein [Kitasatospora sp. KL5]|uniref:hypothetical protein n=1 Tax=Kitasatospora sp. KL5 TaxID=3425125 RepID=UPI003D6F1DF9